MQRRRFLASALAVMGGLLMPRRALAIDPATRRKPASQERITLGRDAKWSASWDVINRDGSIETRSIVVQGPCTIDIDTTQRRVAAPLKGRNRRRPEPASKPVRDDSTDTFLERLTVGASEKNNWFGYGSEEAFERAAQDSIPAGD